MLLYISVNKTDKIMNDLQIRDSGVFIGNNNADIKAFYLEAIKLVPSGWVCKVDISLIVFNSGRQQYEFCIIASTTGQSGVLGKGDTMNEALIDFKRELKIQKIRQDM